MLGKPSARHVGARLERVRKRARRVLPRRSVRPPQHRQSILTDICASSTTLETRYSASRGGLRQSPRLVRLSFSFSFSCASTHRLCRSGRLVSAKPANGAFLSSRSRQAEHAKRVEADRLRRERSSSSSSPTATFTLLRPIILFLVFLPLLSQFLTSTYTFNTAPYFLPRLQDVWSTSPLNRWKREMISFSPVQLAMYDGKDSGLPVYLGIDGDVYDVSRNRRVYGKGGSYNMM